MNVSPQQTAASRLKGSLPTLASRSLIIRHATARRNTALPRRRLMHAVVMQRRIVAIISSTQTLEMTLAIRRASLKGNGGLILARLQGIRASLDTQTTCLTGPKPECSHTFYPGRSCSEAFC
eukprot:437117_1